MEGQSAGRRMLRRLLVRPAARVQSGFVAALALSYAWLERAYPPPGVRSLVTELPIGSRIAWLSLVWTLWLFACTAATRRMLSSGDARLARAWPLSSRDWLRALGPSLVGFQIPLAIVVAYGLAPAGPWVAGLHAVALAALAGLVQPFLVGFDPKIRRLAWVGLAVVPAAVILGGVVSALAAAALVASFATKAWDRAPPESSSRRRWLRLRGVRAWALARPVVAASWFGARRRFVATIAVQLVIAAHVYLALALTTASPGDSLTVGGLWAGAVLGVMLAQHARRLARRTLWYFESLPVTRGLAVVAVAVPAWLLSTPVAAAVSASTVATHGAAAWSPALAAWLVPVWAGCFAARIAFTEEQDRNVVRRRPWVLGAFAGLIGLFGLGAGRLWTVVIAAGVEGWLAWTLEPTARKVRRRFETYGDE